MNSESETGHILSTQYVMINESPSLIFKNVQLFYRDSQYELHGEHIDSITIEKDSALPQAYDIFPKETKKQILTNSDKVSKKIDQLHERLLSGETVDDSAISRAMATAPHLKYTYVRGVKWYEFPFYLIMWFISFTLTPMNPKNAYLRAGVYDSGVRRNTLLILKPDTKIDIIDSDYVDHLFKKVIE